MVCALIKEFSNSKDMLFDQSLKSDPYCLNFNSDIYFFNLHKWLNQNKGIQECL